MKISSPFNRPWPRAPQLGALARFPDGTPIPYICHTELQLPATLDLLDNATGSGSGRSSLATLADAFNSFSALPGAHMPALRLTRTAPLPDVGGAGCSA